MTFNFSANPYVRLIEDVPEFILRAVDGILSEEQRSVLSACRSTYKRLIVELGSGSGSHLVTRAANDPDALFVGFELRFKRLFKTAKKAKEIGVKNLILLQMDARQLHLVFEPGSIDGIYILFPDPWEKRRWHKHRLLNAPNLSAFHTLLKPTGFLHFKTDHSSYFEDTVSLIQQSGSYEIGRLSRNLYQESYISDNIPSEFEKLFKSKQLPVFLLELAKP